MIYITCKNQAAIPRRNSGLHYRVFIVSEWQPHYKGHIGTIRTLEIVLNLHLSILARQHLIYNSGRGMAIFQFDIQVVISV